MHCSQGLSEGATPGYKQRLQVMSRTVPPCHSERKVVWTRRPLCSLSALSLIIDQFDLLHSLRVLWGAVIAQLLRTHILVPPLPHFSKYFFLDLVPPSKKITNANTNTNEDRKDDLHILHREMITNLTPG